MIYVLLTSAVMEFVVIPLRIVMIMMHVLMMNATPQPDHVPILLLNVTIITYVLKIPVQMETVHFMNHPTNVMTTMLAQ
jgi:hypothetical protein